MAKKIQTAQIMLDDNVDEKAEVTVDVQPEDKQPEVIVSPVAKGEKLVKIKPNATFRVYIGNRYHNFVKGEIVSVPDNVKDILMRQGALDAI